MSHRAAGGEVAGAAESILLSGRRVGHLHLSQSPTPIGVSAGFQSAQTSQPIVFYSHKKLAPASPNQHQHRPANRPYKKRYDGRKRNQKVEQERIEAHLAQRQLPRQSKTRELRNQKVEQELCLCVQTVVEWSDFGDKGGRAR